MTTESNLPETLPEGDITVLLRQWGAGQNEAFRKLLPLAYNRLRAIAGKVMRAETPDHTLQPTALVSELYVRLADKQQSGWKDREHFYHFCARAMRWILTDHARTRLAEKRKLELALPRVAEMPWLGRQEGDISSLHMALWKLEALDPRKTKIVEMRIYLGASASETAKILGLSKATVDRDLTLARAWLFRELRPQ